METGGGETAAGPKKTDTLAYAKANVVGAWGYAWSQCNPRPADIMIEAYYFMCPNGGLRGVEVSTGSELSFFGGRLDALAKGSWRVTDNPYSATLAAIVLDYTDTTSRGGVTDTGKGILGRNAGEMVYDAATDSIGYYFNGCWHGAGRLTGGKAQEMSDDSCSSAAGGTDQCGADFDCGRCHYCEKSSSGNVCRYGGEGPYGCYRGWEPPE